MGVEKHAGLVILIIAGLMVVTALLVSLKLIDLADLEKIAREIAPSGGKRLWEAGKRVLAG